MSVGIVAQAASATMTKKHTPCAASAARLWGLRTGEVQSSVPLLPGARDTQGRLGDDDVTVDCYVSLI
jgi:hypothetical protein